MSLPSGTTAGSKRPSSRTGTAFLPAAIIFLFAIKSHGFQPSPLSQIMRGKKSILNAPTSPLHPLHPLHQSRETETDCVKSYSVKVTHQNKSTNLQIRENESILHALERSNVHDELALPSLPHECRRGNCLTCSSRLVTCTSKSGAGGSANGNGNVSSNNVEIRKDGLAPSIEQTIRRKGIVPTCSSFVVGEGVHLDLGKCDDVWKEIYGDDTEGERIRDIAMAKAIRKADENNLNRWALRTKKMLYDDQRDRENE